MARALISASGGRGKLAADMRETWLMQPRLERRVGSGPFTLVEQPRFRAGFDFLRLRADSGEVDAELALWWEEFSLGSDDERQRLMEAVRQREPARRHAAPEPEGSEPSYAAPSADPAKKRRRRRRKPAEGATSAADTATDTAGSTTD